GWPHQGSARGAALGRQPAQRPGELPHAAAPARHGARQCAARARSPGGRRWLAQFPADLCPAVRGCAGLAQARRAAPRARGPAAPVAGTGASRARMVSPHFERQYEHFHTRLGDLDQLEVLSGQYPSRERFLTEVTLDPPNATSDLAGRPALDEDYLVLCTIHSAKGMEWDTV